MDAYRETQEHDSVKECNNHCPNCTDRRLLTRLLSKSRGAGVCGGCGKEEKLIFHCLGACVPSLKDYAFKANGQHFPHQSVFRCGECASRLFPDHPLIRLFKAYTKKVDKVKDEYDEQFEQAIKIIGGKK